MQICITGANGFIGGYLIRALSRQDHSIRVLTRQEGSLFAGNIEVVRGDLTRPDCPIDAFINGCDILFHCAGEVRDEKVMRLLHVDGTKRLIQSVQDNFLRTGRIVHWVQLSSVGTYGPPVGAPETDRVVTEETESNPVNEYEVTKTRSDELVIQASKNGTMTYSILRPANVFGTKMTNQSLRRLIVMVKKKLFFYVGKPGAIATYVHVEDVVAALLICAIEPRAKGKIYNLSSDCKLEDLINHIALLLGVREPWLRIPVPLIRIPLNLFSAFFGRRVYVPSINILILRTRYPTKKIETELDFCFIKSLPGGVEDMVKGFT